MGHLRETAPAEAKRKTLNSKGALTDMLLKLSMVFFSFTQQPGCKWFQDNCGEEDEVDIFFPECEADLFNIDMYLNKITPYFSRNFLVLKWSLLFTYVTVNQQFLERETYIDGYSQTSLTGFLEINCK